MTFSIPHRCHCCTRHCASLSFSHNDMEGSVRRPTPQNSTTSILNVCRDSPHLLGSFLCHPLVASADPLHLSKQSQKKKGNLASRLGEAQLQPIPTTSAHSAERPRRLDPRQLHLIETGRHGLRSECRGHRYLPNRSPWLLKLLRHRILPLLRHQSDNLRNSTLLAQMCHITTTRIRGRLRLPVLRRV